MVTNNTLSGVISQLSDLSRHAEDIFGELTNEAHQFNDRCRVLGERITSLNSRISLDVKLGMATFLVLFDLIKFHHLLNYFRNKNYKMIIPS